MTPAAPDKTTFRNTYTGATFTVVGPDAAARMDALETWVRADEYTHWSVTA